MSDGAAGVPFTLRQPVGRVIETARPVFRWDPVDGASAYTVEIFDENFQRVASSPSLTGTTWKTGSSLPRGRVYLWQVAALVDGAEVRSPTRPAPDAKFKVISSTNERAIDAARRSGSRLALGIAYAEAGMLPEAEAELVALEKLNPRSEAIRILLRKVRAAR
jgi:hypothetical protein